MKPKIIKTIIEMSNGIKYGVLQDYTSILNACYDHKFIEVNVVYVEAENKSEYRLSHVLNAEHVNWKHIYPINTIGEKIVAFKVSQIVSIELTEIEINETFKDQGVKIK